MRMRIKHLERVNTIKKARSSVGIINSAGNDLTTQISKLDSSLNKESDKTNQIDSESKVNSVFSKYDEDTNSQLTGAELGVDKTKSLIDSIKTNMSNMLTKVPNNAKTQEFLKNVRNLINGTAVNNSDIKYAPTEEGANQATKLAEESINSANETLKTVQTMEAELKKEVEYDKSIDGNPEINKE